MNIPVESNDKDNPLASPWKRAGTSLLLLIILLPLAACAPPVQNGEDGNVRIDLSDGARSYVSPETQAKLAYKMYFSGPGGESRSIETSPGKSNVTIFLPLGDWTVRAEAYHEDYTDTVFGTGEARFTVRGGRNNSETISMHNIRDFLTNIDKDDFGVFALIPETLNVNGPTGSDGWDKALETIRKGGNNKNYIINLTGDFAVGGTPIGEWSFGSVTGVTVSLRGQGTNTLSVLDSSPETKGSLLRVRDGQTLILRDLTLKGRNDNNTSLVYVDGSSASLYMKAGAGITDNISSSSIGGGGVYVYGGSFTMKDAEILNNSSSSSGGGVEVANGSFVMESGKITGNIASSSSYGGGVYVYRSGFTMNGGEITGNTASYGGGGVAVSDSTGNFTMNGGKISGNTASNYGGGVFVNGGSFSKTGDSIIYGDVNTSHNSGDAENTATSDTTNGHAVYYAARDEEHNNFIYYYRNETLDTEDNISTGDLLPSGGAGDTLNNWTKR